MAKNDRQTVEVSDSRTPSATFLEPDESFLVENYDPYLEAITEEVQPEEVLRKPPSWWQKLVHALAG
jgi:hypothetical protein